MGIKFNENSVLSEAVDLSLSIIPLTKENLKSYKDIDFFSDTIINKQKQQAQSKFQEYVNATGKQDIEGFKKFVKQPIVEENVTNNQNVNPVANIPQNKVSGISSYGSLVTANDNVIKALGSNPHSIDMIEAGLRTRTTRSESEMAKYAVKVGDIIKHFGKSIDGTTKNILARVTAIHPKGAEGWKGTWYKEGWSESDVDVIDRFKDGAAAIEFEVITINQNTQEQEVQNLKILNSLEFKDFVSKELEKNPESSIEQLLEYYKKCK